MAEEARGAVDVTLLAPGARVVVAGLSPGAMCGVRDHAVVVSAALRVAGVHVSTVWGTGSDARAPDIRRWAGELRRRCSEERADAVLLQYSVFAFSRRGVPVDVLPLAVVLRRLGLPVVLFAHELAYPWGRRGWRGAVQAVSQRAVLIPLLRSSAAAIVTTTDRARWLRTRWWLPPTAVTLAPVFATITPDPSSRAVVPVPGRIGLFGFGAEGLAVELVTGTVADIARRSPQAHLALIGAPGPSSAAGAQWRQAAAAAQCPLTFTGEDDEAGLSRALAACEVFVLADPAGPTTRKTTLAATLAHGKPVVAFDGPDTWWPFVDGGAVAVVTSARGLEDEIYRFLSDPAARSIAGARAKQFSDTHLSPDATVSAVSKAIAASLRRALPSPARPPGGGRPT